LVLAGAIGNLPLKNNSTIGETELLLDKRFET